MNKMLIVIPACMAVGFAAATYFRDPNLPGSPNTANEPSVHFDQSVPLEQRIRALEQAVSEERLARQLLQDEVMFLTGELDQYPAVESIAEPGAQDTDAVAESSNSRRETYRRRFTSDGRTELLIEAGFQPGRAEYIVRRESELQMASLQLRYEAERDGTPYDYSQRDSSSNALRAELGDAEYEQYLQANGRSTNVAVSNVIESSPAQRAGLQIGDEIVRYDGYRVFSMSDLSSQTMQGDPGVSVAVDIMRDGMPMQVVLPRGPVGVSTGRRYSR